MSEPTTGAPPPLPPAARVERALARVQASREALRCVLVPADDPPEHGPAAGQAHAFAGSWRRMRRALRVHPAAAMAMDAAQGWWRRQPLRPAVETTAAELRGIIAPWIRRHPWPSVAAAALLGALLVAGRPWRWPSVHRRVAAAPSRIGRFLWAQVMSSPVQSVIASLVVAMAAARRATTPSGGPEAQPASGPAAAPNDDLHRSETPEAPPTRAAAS